MKEKEKKGRKKNPKEEVGGFELFSKKKFEEKQKGNHSPEVHWKKKDPTI